MNRKCKNHPDRFCYICGKVTLPDRQARTTDFVKKSYHAYFGVKLGDQDKPFAPHICCKTCVQNLRDWRNKRKCSMPFGVPMVWREGKDHSTDCYFCMTNLHGINRKTNSMFSIPTFLQQLSQYHTALMSLFRNMTSTWSRRPTQSQEMKPMPTNLVHSSHQSRTGRCH